MTAAEPGPPIAGDPDAPFWAALKEGSFLLHVCDRCERAYWPASCCVEHGAGAMTWRVGSGHGRIDTFTVFHRAYRPELAARVPYAVAVVSLDEGPYLHTNIVDAAPSDLAVGVPVRWIGPGPDADADRAMFRLAGGRDKGGRA